VVVHFLRRRYKHTTPLKQHLSAGQVRFYGVKQKRVSICYWIFSKNHQDSI